MSDSKQKKYYFELITDSENYDLSKYEVKGCGILGYLLDNNMTVFIPSHSIIIINEICNEDDIHTARLFKKYSTTSFLTLVQRQAKEIEFLKDKFGLQHD